jgi:thioesterase domain-containing protein/acyl carrier protein
MEIFMIFFCDEIPKNIPGKPVPEDGKKKIGDSDNLIGSPEGMTGQEMLTRLTMTEGKLLQLWEEILEFHDISLDDDFFLCGGNSLTAIELLIRIQRQFHINFPPNTIYRHPTIRQQAVLINKKVAETPTYHPIIVPIREEGTLPPLFCIHYLGGWMTCYAELSPYIDSNRPIFGIRARGLEPTETIPQTVEDTVREHVDAIKSVQKEGPYYLLGFSNGGTLGYELACQLTDRGDQVAYLGIIDVSAPAPEVRYLKTLTKNLFPGRILGRIPASIESHLKANPNSIIFFIISTSVRIVFHKILFRSGSKSLTVSVTENLFNANLNETHLERFPEERHSHMKTQLKASYTYLPHKFPGDITLFSTGPDPILFPGDITRGWGSYASGKTVVIAVPGDHSSLFNESNIGVIAPKIEESLVMVDERR